MSTGRLLVDAVSRSFRGTQVLRDVSLSVAPGERVALLGRNGAGKTTLIRMVLGFSLPDRGRISIDGAAPGSATARRLTSCLPENIVFPGVLTGCEILAFHARLKRADRTDVMELLGRAGLGDAAGRQVRTWSRGMRQRLGLCVALAGKPDLLVLDEPESGLDLQARQDFYTILDSVAAAGTAVLLSSHGTGEVEHRTDRVAILRQGRLVADAPLDRLREEADLPVRIRIRTGPEDREEVCRRLGGTPAGRHQVELACAPRDRMARLRAIHALGDMVSDIDVIRPDAADIYRHYAGHDPRNAGP